MRIATWNINSIRARHNRLLAWLEKVKPDVLCLQELKVVGADFPFDELTQAGYYASALGQPTYNGVAILARHEIEDTRRNMGDGVDDSQARFLSARVQDVRVISIYTPNGQSLDADAYVYKQAWLRRLKTYLETHHSPSEPLVLCGDLNIAIDDRDLPNASEYRDGVLFNDTVRELLADILDWGLTDTLRLHHQQAHAYSWWDYRRMGFQRNDGMRIDFVFATEPLRAVSTDGWIDREERRERKDVNEKPSDHAPVIADFDWG